MRQTVNAELNYWIEELEQYEFSRSIEGVEIVEEVIERALESFESELRTLLIDEMHNIIEERTCSDCGVEITDKNRPDEHNIYGRGYCDHCAARNE